MTYQICALATVEGPDSMKDFLKAHGLFSKVALAQRQPLARLGRLDGVPTLWSPQPQDLMDLVYGQAEVRAISCASVAELEALHGTFFIYGQRFIEVVYCPLKPSEEVRVPYLRDPVYRRRLVILRPGTPNQEFQQISEMSFPPLPGLILNPQLFELEDDETQKLYSVLSRVHPPDAFFLPPTFVEAPERSYFSDEESPRQRVREALRRLANDPHGYRDEPALLALWRISDEPCLQDLLAEGASLELPGLENKPTLARLEICRTENVSGGELERGGAAPLPNNVVAEFRRKFVMEPAALVGPDWMLPLASQFKQDLKGLLSGGLEITESLQAKDWTVARALRSDRPAGRQEGNWQRFQSLSTQLGLEELQAYFHGQVLWPSRERDHDLAERLFIANFFRCPSRSPEAELAWRIALCADIVKTDCELSGHHLSVKQRIQFWQSGGWPKLSQPLERGPWILQHLSSDSEVDVLKWRYLLPLESVITTGAMFRLDKAFNALNRGFVLAR